MNGRGRITAMVGLVLALVTVHPQAGATTGLSDEREIGARFAREASRRLSFVREPRVTTYVRALGRRLAGRLDNDQFAYHFYLLQDPSLNAFAVPGGYVYVNTGLVLAAESRAELASVLAHEVIHVDAHHVVRQQEKTQLLSYATLLGLFLSAVHPALGASAVSAGTAVQLKYQREFEQEADHIGLDLMQRAGFDPEGSPAFLRKLLRARGLAPAGLPPYFLSHPLTEDRVGQLEKRVAEMQHPTPEPGTGLELAAVQAVLRTLTEGRTSALARYQPMVDANPTGAEAGYLLGLVNLYGEQPERALPLLAAAVPTVPWARADHGRAMARSGDVSGARGELEAHLRAFPKDVAAELDLARLLVDAGEHAAAVPRLKRVLARDAELDDAEYALAECLGKAGDAYGQWWHLGRAYELRGAIERAVSAYEHARDLASDESPEHAQAARALTELRGTFGDLW